MKLFRRICLVLLLSITATSLSGCLFAVPLIQGFKDAGLTANDRASLLTKDLKRFHHALEDGNRSRLLSYANEEFRSDFKSLLRKTSRFEKIVFAKVDYVDFEEESYKATVEAFVKFYKQSHYIVKERLVEQNWEYSHSGGWKLAAYTVVDEDVQQG